MKVYIDCDIAVKFAKWGLLSRLTQHLTKQGKAEIYTVQTLKYRFKLASPVKAAAMLGSMAAVQQLNSFVVACKPPLGHSKVVAEALTDIPSIDVGEAALFAAAANYDAALVDTGDKNALRALGGLAASNPARAAMQDKLACLEQTLDYLVGRWTFDVVRNAVATNAIADAAAATCFKHGTQAAAIAALAAHVTALRMKCPLLSVSPFAWIPLEH